MKERGRRGDRDWHKTTQERVLSKGEERKTCKDKETRWENLSVDDVSVPQQPQPVAA